MRAFCKTESASSFSAWRTSCSGSILRDSGIVKKSAKLVAPVLVRYFIGGTRAARTRMDLQGTRPICLRSHVDKDLVSTHVPHDLGSPQTQRAAFSTYALGGVCARTCRGPDRADRRCALVHGPCHQADQLVQWAVGVRPIWRLHVSRPQNV